MICNIKYFKTQKETETFINKNKQKYICDMLFIHNGFAVEYKPLKKII